MRADCLSIRVLIMALVASLLISAVVTRPLHAAEAPADMPPDVSAEQQLQAVSEAISQIQRWLQTTRAQRSVEEQALLESSQQLNMLRQQMFANQRQLSVLESELTRLTAEQDVLLKDSEQQRSQQDPAIARRMLVYFEAFNQQRIAHIIRWRDTLAELAVNRETLLTTADQLSDLNNSLQQQQITLESQQLARETLISELTTQMSARDSELDILIADQLELQALINEINSVVIDIPAPEELMPFAASRGNMPWPANGRLLAAYGDVFGAGQLRRHGIVIAAETGSPIRAIHPGRVIFSDWLRGSGNLLIVDHGNAYISLYSHNQQLLKQSGDWVNRGEALALSGEDGGTGEPGLYFEIRRNSETLNPADWLVTPD
jgi:septal ring factor EnvC (AmiA/AmiB activator)